MEARCVYTTGETAEMPGFYGKGDYDLAGFAVGVFDADLLITGKDIEEGDMIFGLPSSGLHSNGYSLVRKLFPPLEVINDKKLISSLLEPTRIYVSLVLDLNKKFNILGWAHITGSGITGKLGKVIPNGLQAELILKNWKIPKIMQQILTKTKTRPEKLAETFNLGLGMIGVIRESEISRLSSYLKSKNEKFYLIGKVRKNKGKKVVFLS